MRRGFVTVAMQGDFGKPRPALVIQADHIARLYDQWMVDSEKVFDPSGATRWHFLVQSELKPISYFGIPK